MDIVSIDLLGAVYAAIAHPRGRFGTGYDGTVTNDPHVQWHRQARINLAAIPMFGRFNGDLNDDLALFERPLFGMVSHAGSVSVSLCAGHAVPEPDARAYDFGFNGATSGVGDFPKAGSRPLLMLLTRYNSQDLMPGRTLRAYEQHLFGDGHPSFRGYVNEVSRGRFNFTKAGAYEVGPPDPTNHHKSLLEAAGNQGFDFRSFDTNGDGVLTGDELSILSIQVDGGTGAQTQYAWSPITLFPDVPSKRIVIRNMAWSLVSGNLDLDTIFHELGHGLGMEHLYGSTGGGMSLTFAGAYVMECNIRHLDPWNKMRLGWVLPLIYDIRDFPGGVHLYPAQHLAYRSVLLYDSARGVHDFHMLEHRDGDYNAGTQTVTAPGGVWDYAPRRGTTSFPKAGYDIHVWGTYRSGSTRKESRRGFAVWSVKTGPDHRVLDIPQRIGRGSDGILQSVPQGDDVYWPSSISPIEIHCGPDGILQTIADPRDVSYQDALCLPITNPDDLKARAETRLVPMGAAETTLHYYGNIEGPLDSGVMVRGEETSPAGYQFLEWGRNFRPWLKKVTFPAKGVEPGSTIQIEGELGQNRFFSRIITMEGQKLTLPVENWTGMRADVVIPDHIYIPPGRHRLLLFDDTTYQTSSNAWFVRVRDLYDAWLLEYFTLADLFTGAVLDDADPDHDGLSNFMELMMKTDPRVPNPAPWTWDFRDPTRPRVNWEVRRDLFRVRVSLERSEDLTNWVETQVAVVSPAIGQPRTSRGSFVGSAAPAPNGRRFYRLRIEKLP